MVFKSSMQVEYFQIDHNFGQYQQKDTYKILVMERSKAKAEYRDGTRALLTA